MSTIAGVAVSPISTTETRIKRRITPSAELSPSKQTLRALVLETPSKRLPSTSPGSRITLQAFSPPRQLFPGGVGQVDQQYTHVHPVQTPKSEQQPRWHTKHVLLPFNVINVDDEEIQMALKSIFPDTENVAMSGGGSYLIFQVRAFPKGPWPLTIGGLPFTIITNDGQGRAWIFPRQKLGASQISICENYNVSELTGERFRQMVADINNYFSINLPEVYMKEVMFTCEQTFYIILCNDVNINSIRTKLPGKVAKRFTGYLIERDISRPTWFELPARRVINPSPFTGIADDTAYDPLRPGVMIHSRVSRHSHPHEFSTTSGILVKNPAGDTFMTASAHGIGEEGTIYQHGHEESILGQAQHVISNTDICLVQLKVGVAFQNETFANTAGVVPRFSRLVGDSENITKDFRICHLNSPYTGHMEASIVAVSVRLPTSSTVATENEVEMGCTVYNWAYSGQVEGNDDNKVRPPTGTCGSVIWDDEGAILGFYEFYIEEDPLKPNNPWAGFSVSVRASEMSKAVPTAPGRSNANYSLA